MVPKIKYDHMTIFCRHCGNTEPFPENQDRLESNIQTIIIVRPRMVYTFIIYTYNVYGIRHLRLYSYPRAAR